MNTPLAYRGEGRINSLRNRGAIVSKPPDLVQGTLDLLLLKILALEPMNGWSIRSAIAADFRRGVAGQRRLAVSGTAQAAAGRLDHRGMAVQRKQPARSFIR
jgi:hypothetical protein